MRASMRGAAVQTASGTGMAGAVLRPLQDGLHGVGAEEGEEGRLAEAWVLGVVRAQDDELGGADGRHGGGGADEGGLAQVGAQSGGDDIAGGEALLGAADGAGGHRLLGVVEHGLEGVAEVEVAHDRAGRGGGGVEHLAH